MGAKHGKGGRVAIGASPANLRLAEHTVDDAGEDADATTFESSGKGEGVSGVEELSFSFKGAWDFAAEPTAATPGVYPRDDLAVVKLYRNYTAASYWGMDVARILSAKSTTAVRGGAVGFEASGKSQGAFTR